MDRSGYARGTLAPRQGMSAAIPEQRKTSLCVLWQTWGMSHDMSGMDMGGSNNSSHDMSGNGHGRVVIAICLITKE